MLGRQKIPECGIILQNRGACFGCFPRNAGDFTKTKDEFFGKEMIYMKIAIMGFGVVGSGVGEVVTKNQEMLSKLYSIPAIKARDAGDCGFSRPFTPV